MKQKEFQDFVVNNFTSLNERITEQEKSQELVAKHLTIQSEDIKSMKGDISSLKSIVTRIETRMENEIIDKIKGLFDGQKQHEDRLSRIEKIAR